MAERIPLTILKNLLHNEKYTRKVLPFIKEEFFDERTDRVVFEEIGGHVQLYDGLPTKEVLHIEIEGRDDLSQDEHKLILDTIDCLEESEVDHKWLLDTTEKWCKERAIYLALMQSIKIADGQDEKKQPDAIPSILSDALAAVSYTHLTLPTNREV